MQLDHPHQEPHPDFPLEQLNATDWNALETRLYQSGSAVLKNLLPSATCAQFQALYQDDNLFRKTVVMEKHGYGQGEYRYFNDPLPSPVTLLRSALYERLVPLVRTMTARMGYSQTYPDTLDGFTQLCHAAGQRRPTPLLLRYKAGDYNRLHQDLYGEIFFPLQVAVLLSQPGRDFSGGEFVLTEQRPRLQSRVEVVPLAQGDAVIFAVRDRPNQGPRGIHRVQMRHGVSTLHSGQRMTLGIIFHDAT